MSCGCMELEAKHGQGDCKCVHYRESFPGCDCEKRSVSQHSPGVVENDEMLVRTIFKERMLDPEGRLKPVYFRRDLERRGFSVDRISHIEAKELKSSKRTDPRYEGHLKFISAVSENLRNLMDENGTRLYCIYDTATAENRAHADICQNLVLQPGTGDRKKLMMDMSWQLSYAFEKPQREPPRT